MKVKRKIKYILCLMFSLCTVGCEKTPSNNTSPNFNEEEFVEISFSTPHKKNVNKYYDIILNERDYMFINDKPNKDDCYNIMPIEYIKKYNINAILIEYNGQKDVCFLYDESICFITKFENDTNIVLCDINQDSYFEVVVTSYNHENESFFTRLYDSKSDFCSSARKFNSIKPSIKKGSSTEVEIYGIEKNGNNETKKLLYVYEKYNKKLNLSQESFFATTDNFELTVNSISSSASYETPSNYDIASYEIVDDKKVLTEDIKQVLRLKTILLWTAEEFCYYKEEVFEDSAYPFFRNNDFITNHRVVWWMGCPARKYTVKTGDIITFETAFYQKEFKEGKYDLLVEYRGEEVVFENALCFE